MTQKLSRVLLVGADGMLGRAWGALLEKMGIAFQRLARPSFDLTRSEDIDSLGDASHVINCAAWTDVDGAEAQEAAATSVNGESVGLLARRAAVVGATLVHYGTDYVFNGEARAPYPVDAPIDPVNAYGRSKARGEAELNASGATVLLVRTSWLYAPWGQNFVRTMAKLGTVREELRVVDDQHGRPTSCERLAAGTLALLESGALGTFHVTDGGSCSWFGLAQHIIAKVNPACRVVPCTSEEFPRPARRPRYSVLDLTQTEARIGPREDWRTAVDDVLDRLEP